MQAKIRVGNEHNNYTLHGSQTDREESKGEASLVYRNNDGETDVNTMLSTHKRENTRNL